MNGNLDQVMDRSEAVLKRSCKKFLEIKCHAAAIDGLLASAGQRYFRRSINHLFLLTRLRRILQTMDKCCIRAQAMLNGYADGTDYITPILIPTIRRTVIQFCDDYSGVIETCMAELVMTFDAHGVTAAASDIEEIRTRLVWLLGSYSSLLDQFDQLGVESLAKAAAKSTKNDFFSNLRSGIGYA